MLYAWIYYNMSTILQLKNKVKFKLKNAFHFENLRVSACKINLVLRFPFHWLGHLPEFMTYLKLILDTIYWVLSYMLRAMLHPFPYVIDPEMVITRWVVISPVSQLKQLRLGVSAEPAWGPPAGMSVQQPAFPLWLLFNPVSPWKPMWSFVNVHCRMALSSQVWEADGRRDGLGLGVPAPKVTDCPSLVSEHQNTPEGLTNFSSHLLGCNRPLGVRAGAAGHLPFFLFCPTFGELRAMELGWQQL